MLATKMEFACSDGQWKDGWMVTMATSHTTVWQLNLFLHCGQRNRKERRKILSAWLIHMCVLRNKQWRFCDCSAINSSQQVSLQENMGADARKWDCAGASRLRTLRVELFSTKRSDLTTANCLIFILFCHHRNHTCCDGLWGCTTNNQHSPSNHFFIPRSLSFKLGFTRLCECSDVNSSFTIIVPHSFEHSPRQSNA